MHPVYMKWWKNRALCAFSHSSRRQGIFSVSEKRRGTIGGTSRDAVCTDGLCSCTQVFRVSIFYLFFFLFLAPFLFRLCLMIWDMELEKGCIVLGRFWWLQSATMEQRKSGVWVVHVRSLPLIWSNFERSEKQNDADCKKKLLLFLNLSF